MKTCLEMKTCSETKTCSFSSAFNAFSGERKKKNLFPCLSVLSCLSCLGSDSAPEENDGHQAEGMHTSNLTLETDVLKERKWGMSQTRLNLV